MIRWIFLDMMIGMFLRIGFFMGIVGIWIMVMIVIMGIVGIMFVFIAGIRFIFLLVIFIGIFKVIRWVFLNMIVMFMRIGFFMVMIFLIIVVLFLIWIIWIFFVVMMFLLLVLLLMMFSVFMMFMLFFPINLVFQSVVKLRIQQSR